VQFTVEEKRHEPEALDALGTSPIPEAITVAGVRVPTDVLERRSQVGRPDTAA
jgi:endonuclease G